MFSAGLGLSACSSFGAGESPAEGTQSETADGGLGTDASSSSGDAGGTGDGSGDGGDGDRYRAAVLADSPIAYFRFEETTGTAAKNEIADSPVTAILPATGVTLGVDGISAARHALRLDSATSQLNVFGEVTPAGGQPFTVEAWAELTLGNSKSQSVFSNMTDQSSDARVGQWMFVDADGLLRTETWDGTGLLFYTNIANTLSTSPTWVHLVFMYSDTEQRDIVYVNGATGEGQRVKDGQRLAVEGPLKWSGFTGRLDEIAIYDKALTPARIAAHLAAR